MKKGFTLSEVLITLTIIGVVASLSIPSVISNSQQSEYQTGLRKAVSALNSAITLGLAKEGISPKDLTKEYTLFEYLSKHMSVMKSTTNLSTYFYAKRPNIASMSGYVTNKAFYTPDGMRYEMASNIGSASMRYKTHETATYLNLCYGYDDCNPGTGKSVSHGFNCGSYGLKKEDTSLPQTRGMRAPCLITVDVNGDRKPNPANINCKKAECAENYKIADVMGKRLTDVFSVMITDKEAIPFGVAAQRAMYSGASKRNKN